MQRVGSSTEDVRLLPETLQSIIEAWVARTAGLTLVIAAAIGWASIITWSNLDPSLTHTTSDLTHNLLGPFGAILSDLLLQTLGLSALFALAGPMIWGLELSAARRVPKLATKLILFPASVLVVAGGLSGVPTLPSWPLHNGFGGLLGDLMFNMAAAVLTPVMGERAGMLSGLSLLAGGLACLVHSFGLSVGDLIRGGVHGLPLQAPKLQARRTPAEPQLDMRDPVHADEADDQDHEVDEEPAAAFAARSAGDEVLVRDATPRLHLNTANDMDNVDEADVLGDEDPAFEDARSFAKRFAPASAAPELARSSPSLDAPVERRAGPHKLPGMLRGLAPARSKGWRRPQLGLLKRTSSRASETDTTKLHERAGLLSDVLADFGVEGEVRDIRSGPVVTRFEFQPARGIKTSRIVALADDIARAMSAMSARVAPIPGRSTLGIELPNPVRSTVTLRSVLDSDSFRSAQALLAIALGASIDGEPVVADLARMPHLLVAGTTGSGKSVGISAMILSLLYKHDPKDCRLLLIDPKMLEFAAFDGIPHLLSPVITDHREAVAALEWAAGEMEERYKRMARLGVRNIETFNNRIEHAARRDEPLERTVQTGFDPDSGEPIYERQTIEEEAMPHIVIVVDEFADLMTMAGRELEIGVQRLAQKARAAGIHMIMATQRPSVDIVTGTIKANFPTRISFRVASKVDSRTILGEAGAEQLLGQGDMLLAGGAGQPVRVHGAYVSEDEVEAVVATLKAQGQTRYERSLTAALAEALELDEPRGNHRQKRRASRS
jgi:S-DNA-T family DNA segregation ATPase FtsK/SpoIIIE